eukprot:Nk52_evm35s2325 gene=Nk52_evmTU35s2325
MVNWTFWKYKALNLKINGIIFICGGAFCITIGLIMGYAVPEFANNVVLNGIVIPSNDFGSDAFKQWQSSNLSDSVPKYNRVNFFHLKNKDDFYKGKNPIFVSRGPYTWREYQNNVAVTFWKGLIHHKQWMWQVFQPSLSAPGVDPDNDIIVMINPIVLVLLNTFGGDAAFYRSATPGVVSTLTGMITNGLLPQIPSAPLSLGSIDQMYQNMLVFLGNLFTDAKAQYMILEIDTEKHSKLYAGCGENMSKFFDAAHISHCMATIIELSSKQWAVETNVILNCLSDGVPNPIFNSFGSGTEKTFLCDKWLKGELNKGFTLTSAMMKAFGLAAWNLGSSEKDADENLALITALFDKAQFPEDSPYAVKGIKKWLGYNPDPSTNQSVKTELINKFQMSDNQFDQVYNATVTFTKTVGLRYFIENLKNSFVNSLGLFQIPTDVEYDNIVYYQMGQDALLGGGLLSNDLVAELLPSLVSAIPVGFRDLEIVEYARKGTNTIQGIYRNDIALGKDQVYYINMTRLIYMSISDSCTFQGHLATDTFPCNKTGMYKLVGEFQTAWNAESDKDCKAVLTSLCKEMVSADPQGLDEKGCWTAMTTFEPKGFTYLNPRVSKEMAVALWNMNVIMGYAIVNLQPFTPTTLELNNMGIVNQMSPNEWCKGMKSDFLSTSTKGAMTSTPANLPNWETEEASVNDPLNKWVTLKTGENNVGEVLEWVSWPNQYQIASTFPQADADQLEVAGHDGTQFLPKGKVSHGDFSPAEETVAAWVVQAFRAVHLVYSHNQDYKGITLNMYKPSPKLLYPGYYNNTAYGITDRFECFQPLEAATKCPSFLSQPWFYNCPQAVKDNVTIEGDAPGTDDLETYIGVEPWTGKAMYAHKRLQANLMVLPKFATLPPYNGIKAVDIVLPWYWCDQFAFITDDLADKFKTQLYGGVDLSYISLYLGPIGGGCAIILGFVMLYFWVRNGGKQWWEERYREEMRAKGTPVEGDDYDKDDLASSKQSFATSEDSFAPDKKR